MRRQNSRVQPDLPRFLGTLLAVLVLVWACGSSERTVVPSVEPSPRSPAPIETPSASSSTATLTATPTTEPTSLPSMAAAHWESAGKMAPVLESTSAALLGDGRVLVLGTDVDTATTHAAIWDPSNGSWRSAETLDKPRTEFAMVSLQDGRVLVTGGLNDRDQSYSSTFIFDPRTERWTKSGALSHARSSPAVAVLHDGRVLVAGGYYAVKPTGLGPDAGVVLAGYRSGIPSNLASPPVRPADVTPPHVGAALATAEIFDPSTGAWSATGSLNYARSGADAVTLAAGGVLVVGSDDGSSTGVSVDGRAVLTAEIFDPTTGRFSHAGRLPEIDRVAIQKQGAKGANPVPEEPPSTADPGSLIALKSGGAVLIGQTGWWKHVGDVTRSFGYDASNRTWHEIGSTWIVVGEPTGVALTTPHVPNSGRRDGGGVAGRARARCRWVGDWCQWHDSGRGGESVQDAALRSGHEHVVVPAADARSPDVGHAGRPG